MSIKRLIEKLARRIVAERVAAEVKADWDRQKATLATYRRERDRLEAEMVARDSEIRRMRAQVAAFDKDLRERHAVLCGQYCPKS